ncbi:acetate--CoA ligase family protein [Frankia sp. CNm7]|uniref:Acetate--CoA ligase family protein n=1 Tax=Frankia nepalensis TaxID=1836974 RepID=A0A937RUF1_9ACTN|nr:acetate--CoA ligase family protein [Frankia nepalensis]MBL7499166.1 acetate--CoA ligase family protein [Frankia nepalensis]MBL7511016.1 acetate--CoA ligase family protein [Frankia nepalensis]MBL7520516.1 acetate--CoA ligase family protein [Frankia nepalensis]MBL7632096.1 acetate--CoA ligase family protein [Frankia nepalensis]
MTGQTSRQQVLETLLRPRAVAIVGAGDQPTTFNGAPIHNLQSFGYSGQIYPVNPGRAEVQGIACHRSVLDIPGPVDTAVVTVPARLALPVLEECVEKGIPSVTLVSSGFGEGAAGEQGQARAADLEALIGRSGLRVLGPNTAGLLNLFDSYVPRAAHNHHGPGEVRLGPVALVSQSGACGNTLFNRAQANGVGVGISVATGDQVDVDVWDLIEYFLSDFRISVIMAVIESFGSVAKARAVAAAALALGKPIVLLKVGQSTVGRAVVQAHSGAIAGDAAAQASVLRDHGVITVQDLDELWEVARLVEVWGRPPAEPLRLGVVSVSGGEAALIADQCARADIALPPATDAFAAFVDETFEYAKGANPFDPTGEVVSRPTRLREGIAAFASKNDFSHVLVASPVFGPELAERYYAELPGALANLDAKAALSAWPAGQFTRTQVALLSATGHPVFPNSVRAVHAMSLYQAYGLRAPELLASLARRRRPPEGATSAEFEPLSYAAARELLGKLGLPFVEARACASAQEAAATVQSLGGRVALKANVPSAVHKADHGLIEFHSGGDPAVVLAAYERIVRAGREWDVSSVVVEGFAFGQIQLILGAHRDAEFGPLVLFGSGGGAVEYLDDVALGLADLTDTEAARRLVTGTRIGGYLQVKAPQIVADLARALESIAQFMVSSPGCQSIDVNPCIVDMTTRTWSCADARVV